MQDSAATSSLQAKYKLSRSMRTHSVLASVRIVYSCEKHQNADRLWLVKLQGLGTNEPCDKQMVTNEEHFPGEYVVFIDQDAVVPQAEMYAFMASRRWRVGTVRLRGELSHGLIFSLTSAWTVWMARLCPSLTPDDLCEGFNLTQLLGIRQYLHRREGSGPSVFRQNKQKGHNQPYLHRKPSLWRQTVCSKQIEASLESLQQKVEALQSLGKYETQVAESQVHVSRPPNILVKCDSYETLD
jgi:hypothetical protein